MPPVKNRCRNRLPPAPPPSTAAVAKGREQAGVSPEHIKEKIRELIGTEGQKPFSDQKLAEKLADEGITISRRAVAKYRIQMNIPDSRQRAMLL